MVTAHGREDLFAHIRELHIAGSLLKPVSPSLLFDAMVGALEQQAPTEVQAAAPQRMTSIAGARLLVAEDNLINQQIAQEILESAGAAVTLADNGQIAVDKLQSGSYDLVLMDCQMPEMDGFEATRRLRDPASGVLDPRVRVVALTANAMAGDRERCLAAGMDDHLPKPIQIQTLAAMLAKCKHR
jgi:two-component system sensor histidine kinase/response regulator